MLKKFREPTSLLIRVATLIRRARQRRLEVHVSPALPPGADDLRMPRGRLSSRNRPACLRRPDDHHGARSNGKQQRYRHEQRETGDGEDGVHSAGRTWQQPRDNEEDGRQEQSEHLERERQPAAQQPVRR